MLIYLGFKLPEGLEAAAICCQFLDSRDRLQQLLNEKKTSLSKC